MSLFFDGLNDPFHSVPDSFAGGGRTRLDLPGSILDEVEAQAFSNTTRRCCVHLMSKMLYQLENVP